MDFKINNTNFSNEITYNNHLSIKSLKKVYNVYYSSNDLKMLVNNIYNDKDFIFIDKNIYNLNKKFIDSFNSFCYIYEATEHNKTIESVLNLVDNLYNINFTKYNKLIVIGGGITQDIGGFTADIYKRGIKWDYIPTTFLSMTDSCVGGKVCINKNGKNMLGLFTSPDNVYISDYFLKTLNNDDIISGIGESFKLSLIGGINTYDLFMKNYYLQNYIDIIKISLLIKKQIIELDEFDKNQRQVLNYGHSIGHAIEYMSNYYIPHGISVLIGMYIKNVLFFKEKYKIINNFILSLIHPKFFNIKFNFDLFIKNVLTDKKNNNNNICFILLESIGNTKTIYINVENIILQLKYIINELFKDNTIII